MRHRRPERPTDGRGGSIEDLADNVDPEDIHGEEGEEE
jgi:hypothetical protein